VIPHSKYTFTYSGVQHILCWFFLCFVFLRLVYPILSVSLGCSFLIALRHSLTFIYPMMPVSLDCPLLIAPSVFSNVYLYNIEYPKFTEYCFVCGNEVKQTLVTESILLQKVNWKEAYVVCDRVVCFHVTF
jgi:hypothetical protein